MDLRRPAPWITLRWWWVEGWTLAGRRHQSAQGGRYEDLHRQTGGSDQNRPRLFDRHIVLPELLYSRVIEAEERVAADGEVLQPLDEAHLRERLWAAFDAGLRSVAVVFMHGYRFTAHEQAAARIAREVGFTQVSASHETSPMMKFVSRGEDHGHIGLIVIERRVNGKSPATKKHTHPGNRLRIIQIGAVAHRDLMSQFR